MKSGTPNAIRPSLAPPNVASRQTFTKQPEQVEPTQITHHASGSSQQQSPSQRHSFIHSFSPVSLYHFHHHNSTLITHSLPDRCQTPEATPSKDAQPYNTTIQQASSQDDDDDDEDHDHDDDEEKEEEDEKKKKKKKKKKKDNATQNSTVQRHKLDEKQKKKATKIAKSKNAQEKIPNNN
ncbi:hypothetical protein EX30DRAFT_57841 [Ascodesmis nigricans]|uniref:Uncharacterized protein n=1 Tax=Ascodesmis nigricans TaxID=341454 RepID=A0A4S2MUU8_9PEZI|nr:hypothetical protein EX30DRAFT_57841 [Ascodesmis nigricans]